MRAFFVKTLGKALYKMTSLVVMRLIVNLYRHVCSKRHTFTIYSENVRSFSARFGATFLMYFVNCRFCTMDFVGTVVEQGSRTFDLSNKALFFHWYFIVAAFTNSLRV